MSLCGRYVNDLFSIPGAKISSWQEQSANIAITAKPPTVRNVRSAVAADGQERMTAGAMIRRRIPARAADPATNKVATKTREKLKSVKAGEWVTPVRKGYRMQCCDCGLIHRMDFRIVKDTQGRNKIQMRGFRE